MIGLFFFVELIITDNVYLEILQQCFSQVEQIKFENNISAIFQQEIQHVLDVSNK